MSVSEVAEAAVRGYIVPGYGRVAQQAELQTIRMDELCKAANVQTLERARDQFRALERSWSRMDTIRFGPVLEDNRLERILFFPDRRGIGLRQIRAVLARKDPSALDVTALRGKSVALQGLTALEYVLFGTGSDGLAASGEDFRCQYGKTIAKAIWATSDKLVDLWLRPGGTADHLVNPGPDLPDYRSRADVLSELVGIFVHGSELIRDVRITPMLGDGPNAPKPKAALFWRSEETLFSLKANAAGLRDLFIISGLGDLLDKDQRWAAGAYVAELENFIDSADTIPSPVGDALARPAGWGRVLYLATSSKAMQNIMVGEIATPLGVGVGFSTLDGD